LNRKNEGTSKPVLATRIAIDTGPAVLDATGEIFGDVANIAARAQALADPSAVVVTARVPVRSPSCSMTGSAYRKSSAL
jgi:class 3 adenylate cyclase